MKSNCTNLLRTLVVAGAVAATALAQTGGTAGSSSTQAGSGSGSGSSSSSSSPMLGKADGKFMTEAAEGGIAEVQHAQMAQQKASSQEVKDYARRLEQDHSKANDQLKTIAQQRQASLPTDTNAKHKQMGTKLNGLSGADFDRAYISMMIQDHRKDIKEFEKEANNGMDSDLKNFASSQLPTLREHLQMAEQINGSTRSRKASSSSSSSSSSGGNMDHSSGSSSNSGSSTSGNTSGSSSTTPTK